MCIQQLDYSTALEAGLVPGLNFSSFKWHLRQFETAAGVQGPMKALSNNSDALSRKRRRCQLPTGPSLVISHSNSSGGWYMVVPRFDSMMVGSGFGNNATQNARGQAK